MADNENRKTQISSNSQSAETDGKTTVISNVSADFKNDKQQVESHTVVFTDKKFSEEEKSAYYLQYEALQQERAEEISEQIKSNVVFTEEKTEEKQPEKIKKEKEPKEKTDVFDFVEMLVLSVAFVILLFTFGVRNVFVDGLSMYPTLDNKDLLLITDVVDYDYGDIIVFIPDGNRETTNPKLQKPFIKRAIAFEGDVVEVDYINNRVLVNGEEINEEYLEGIIMTDEGDISYPFTVPENHIFFLGDNRNGSWDSRFKAVGTVDSRLVMGKVVLRVFPFDVFGLVE